MSITFNLKTPEYSYFFGFAQLDGHMRKNTRNRGRLSFEINKKDIDILEKFKEIIPYKGILSERIRDTNFKKNYHSCILNFHDFEFRTTLEYLGLPYGKKSDIVKPPEEDEYSKIDYIRGLIDADGSLGMTAERIPFISLTTKSDYIAKYYMDFINSTLNFNICSNRNKRDNIYNICLTSKKAQKIVNILYYENCLCLNRKREKAQLVKNWQPNL